MKWSWKRRVFCVFLMVLFAGVVWVCLVSKYSFLSCMEMDRSDQPYNSFDRTMCELLN